MEIRYLYVPLLLKYCPTGRAVTMGPSTKTVRMTTTKSAGKIRRHLALKNLRWLLVLNQLPVTKKPLIIRKIATPTPPSELSSRKSDGSLTPRSRPEALIHDEAAAVAQVLRMIKEGRVRATDGTDVAISADTICVHGDGPRAVAFARRLREVLQQARIQVRAVES